MAEASESASQSANPAQQHPLTLASVPPTTGVAISPGWFRDPWHPRQWRWFDGQAWTPHVSAPSEAKPRLPDWISVPVIIGLVVLVPALFVVLYLDPAAVLLGLVPIAFVFPSMVWIDRVEPEPQGARIHAMLWGAAVAGSISGIVNSVVVAVFSPEAATVVSAPLVEEATKAAGIIWVLRRGYVDSAIDGIVYAGWVGLGFAVVEDMLYFLEAGANGVLPQTFVVRAIFTPFAHPLFTLWTGLGIGWATFNKKSVWLYGTLGYLVAAGLHMGWNGSLILSEATGDLGVLAFVVVLFVGLFFVCAGTLVWARRRQLNRFAEDVPFLARQYNIAAAELAVFTHPRMMLTARRRLTRKQRLKFDALHAALARLSLLHRSPGPIDPDSHWRLVDQLHRSREVMAAAMKTQ